MFETVFMSEVVRASRRGRNYYLRWAYAGLLIVQLLFVYSSYDHEVQFAKSQGHSGVNWASAHARGLVDLFVGQQLVFTLLLAPAFAAGAITDEKSRGTLEHLLVTQLSPWQIVWGKLLARVAEVALLSLTTWPVIAFVGVFGGVTPEFMLTLAVVTVMMLFGICGVAVLCSVWTRHTREAVIVTYLALWSSFMAFGGVLPAWSRWLDPLHVFQAARDQPTWPQLFKDLWQFSAAWGGVGLLCGWTASWRLRPAHIRQIQAKPKKAIVWLRQLSPRPGVFSPPLVWKECFAGRHIPMIVSIPLMTALSVFYFWSFHEGGRTLEQAIVSGVWWVLLLSALWVAVRTSGTITGEREKQTWEGLLVTPLKPREMVRDKLTGVLCSVWPFVMAFYLPAIVFAAVDFKPDPTWAIPAAGVAILGVVLLIYAGLPPIPYGLGLLMFGLSTAGGWETCLVVGFGIALTWVAMFYAGCVGVWCSSRLNSSWRSMLSALVMTYLGGIVLVGVATPFACVSCCLFSGVIGVLASGMGGGQNNGFLFGVLATFAYIAGAAVVFLWACERFLKSAELFIARHDRIPTGRIRLIDLDLPLYPRRRQHDDDLPEVEEA